MKGKEYIERTLDLLVDMAKHCISKEITVEGRSKCADCDLCWNFNIRNHGCLLVNMADNSDLLEDLISICEAHSIDYKDRLNKVANIFVTGDDEEEE